MTAASPLVAALDLSSRNVLVVGAAHPSAADRIRSLSAAAASVTLVAPAAALSPAIKALVADGAIAWLNRPLADSDLDGKLLALVAEPDLAAAARVAALCRSRGVLVAATDPAVRSDIDLAVPAPLDSSASSRTESPSPPSPASVASAASIPASDALSTLAGSTPAHIGKRLHRQVSATLPLKTSAALANISALSAALPPFSPRSSAFVDHLAETWGISRLASLTPADIDTLVKACGQGTDKPDIGLLSSVHGPIGSVAFVDVASDDANLLTRAAFNAIVDADIVIADASVPASILDLVVAGGLVRLDAASAGRHGFGHSVTVHAVEAGKQAVRLVWSPSGASSTADDERALLEAEGIATSVVPTAGRVSAKTAAVETSAPAAEVSAKPDDAQTLVDLHRHHAASTASAVALSVPRHTVTGRTGARLVIDASDALSRVVYALSDLVFIYPVLQTEYVGRQLLDLSAAATQNARSVVPKVVKLATSAASGRVFQGAAASAHSSSQSATAVLSSAALGSLLPALYSMARDGHAPVLHVGAHTIDADFAVHANYADVLKAAHTGFAILASASVQEVHDMAVIAHAVSQIAHTPVLHFFDAARVAGQTAVVNVVSPASVSAAISSLAGKVSATQPTVDSCVDAVDAVFDGLAATLGARYHPVEYHGPSDASIVIVSMGLASALARETVDAFAAAGTGPAVGALNVRLYRPWSPARLVAALPASATTVVVIGDAADDLASHSAFTLDVVSAIYAAAATGKAAPRVFKPVFAKGAQHFTSLAITKLVRELASGGAVHHAIAFDAADASLEEFKRAAAVEAVFWDRDVDGTRAVGDKVVAHFTADESAFVQRATQHLGACIEPKTVTHLRYGPAPITTSELVHAADLVQCHDASILATHNVVASVRAGGKLLVNTAQTPAEFAKSLDVAVRQSILERRVSVSLLNVARVAKDFTIFYGTPADYANDILQAAFLRLAFDGSDFDDHYTRLVARVQNGESSHNIARTKLLAMDRGIESLVAVDASLLRASDDDVDALSTVVSALDIQPTIPAARVQVGEAAAATASDPTSTLVSPYHAALPVMFPAAFRTQRVLRPDIDGPTFQVRVTENVRLTPGTYDRNIFHIEFDTTGTGLTYDIGDALGVHAHNDPVAVRAFLEHLGVSGDTLVAMDRESAGGRKVSELRSLEHVFTQVLDIFGKPGKKFYQYLAYRAADADEQERLLSLLDATEVLDAFVAKHTPTFVDLLKMFPSARVTVDELVRIVPAIKPRHYSIASSQRVHPNSVHLLVVLVDWVTPTGETRFGQATRYLVNARPGQAVTVSIKPSVMRLPERLTDPVIMAGLGTGMAPFRAFIEERWYWRSKGFAVGPMVLYFGSRHRSMEYLYGEELDAYHADGLLTHLGLAFSRDQADKVYIQHKIAGDADLIYELMVKQSGNFYLCGPTWPVPDVADALVSAFQSGMAESEARELLERFKETERYVLEVY
ncbi:hypothetical protein BC831DRAFT_455497 [Entophlyctis helioformis]|nr:hypothetical protein BC831DRAFT_455497 [Entophlyctis helioformis]